MNSVPEPALRAECERQLALDRFETLLQRLAVSDRRQTLSNPLDTTIHPKCQMLSHSLRHHQHAGLSISQYYAVALQQFHTARAVMDLLEKPRTSVRFIDFACGFGRLLRFLVRELKPQQISAAEIQTEALDWVSSRYGVKTLLSGPEPERFEAPGQFDLIWVVSLFSHLPDGLFQRWLETLSGLLEPDGLLAFTTHDQALLPPEVSMPESGHLFITGSENADLDPAIYGTSFVTEDYVRKAVAGISTNLELTRLPRLMGFEQDLYLLARPGRLNLEALDRLRRGMRGWLDGCEKRGDRLHLHGWAASMDDPDAVTLEARLDDRILECNLGEARPAVAAALGRPELSHCGWSLNLPFAALDQERYLSIVALNHRDPPALVYAGPIGLAESTLPANPG